MTTFGKKENNNSNSFTNGESRKGKWASYKEAFFAPKVTIEKPERVIDTDNVKSFIGGIPDEASIQVSGKEVKKTANIIEAKAKEEGYLLGVLDVAKDIALAYISYKSTKWVLDKLTKKSY